MKANSERVIGKNFRLLGGQPLFMWILKTLQSVDVIDKIVINTDARSIINKFDLKDMNKVIIKDRPKEICGDLVSMNKIIENDLNDFQSDLYLMTHTTNPFLKSETIKNAISFFIKDMSLNNSDSLFSVNKVQERFFNKDAIPINHDLDNLIRTQDLDPWYKENSNLYLFSKDSFMDSANRIGRNAVMFPMDTYESLDIDNEDDWNFAEVIATKNFRKS